VKEPLRYAVVGCGRIAPLHLQAIAANPRARLVATCDIIEERAKRAAERFGAEFHSTDYRDLFHSGRLDAVSLCLPHHLHADAIVAAAEASLHVFCEKPISTTPGDADRAIAACDAAGVTLGICLQNRYNAASRVLRQAVERGRFGRLLQAGITFQNRKTPDYYRDPWHGRWATEGGGTLTTQTLHTIDLMLWTMGPACAVRHTFWSQRLEVVGTEGKAVLHNNRVVEWDFADGAPDRQEVMAIDELRGVPDERGRYGFGHERILSEFVECLLDGRPFPIDGREGRKVSDLLWATYESARTGQRVPVREGDRLSTETPETEDGRR